MTDALLRNEGKNKTYSKIFRIFLTVPVQRKTARGTTFANEWEIKQSRGARFIARAFVPRRCRAYIETRRTLFALLKDRPRERIRRAL